MLAIAADSESDGVDARLVVEARVARAVLAQEAAEPCLGQLGNLVASGVRGLDSREVDGGPPGLFGNDRVPGQHIVQAALQLDQGVIAKPLVRAVRSVTSGSEGCADDSRGLGHNFQSAVLADDDELAPYALLKLMERAVPPTDLLVGDELQRDRVRQAAGQLADNRVRASADSFMS